MSKRFVIAGLTVVAGLALAQRVRRLDFEKLIEGMPEDAPPKWMFRNISAIRQNTDRILELVESGK